jgi:hypothetical protein
VKFATDARPSQNKAVCSLVCNKNETTTFPQRNRARDHVDERDLRRNLC